AGCAAGAERECSGKAGAALAAYRQAFDLMRPAFPTYAGRTVNIRPEREVGQSREMDECRMLRHVHQSIRRLDPSASDTMRGGIRFRIGGVQISPKHVIYLQVTLHAAGIKKPSLWPTTGGGFPSQLDQTVWVG